MVKSGLEIHRQLYRDQCAVYNNTILSSKSQYLQSEIAQSDNKQLFRLVNKLTSPSSSLTLPEHQSDEHLANEFAQFFQEKTQNIARSFDSVGPLDDRDMPVPEAITSSFTHFQPTSEDAVRKVVVDSPSKSCSLDPVPTWIVKLCLNFFHISLR